MTRGGEVFDCVTSAKRKEKKTRFGLPVTENEHQSKNSNANNSETKMRKSF